MRMSQMEIAPENWAQSLSRKQVEKIADKVIKLTGFNAEDTKVEEAIHFFKGTIEYKNLSMEQANSGSMHVKGCEDFTIFLSDSSSELRDNFTLAHELGHYIIHSELGKKSAKFTRYGSHQMEWEANWFAAALLMPKKKFQDMAKKYEYSTIKLAAYFNVSEMAIEVRKKVLKINGEQ